MDVTSAGIPNCLYQLFRVASIVRAESFSLGELGFAVMTHDRGDRGAA